MSLELNRAVVNFNGVPVPGFFRNGMFLGETPIETFLLFRSGAFTANQSKSFLVDLPIKPKTVLVSDTNADTTYTFTVTTPENVIWTMPFTASNMLHCKIIGNSKLIDFPSFVLDKGSRVTISPSKAIQGIAFFAGFASNVEIEDF